MHHVEAIDVDMEVDIEEIPKGPLQLLIIQGTPFCNIDCDYCYLPNRSSNKKISHETVSAIFDRVFSSSLVENDFTVVWHAGEPLVMSIDFYKEAIRRADSENTTSYNADQYIQTNGLLLDQDWCNFIKDEGIELGISIDGPAFIHNSSRKTRRNEGTHGQVMDAVGLLQNNNIPFRVITVLTELSLRHPREMFDFYVENGINNVGFNIEEIEGINESSTMESSGTLEKFRSFMGEFYELCERSDSSIQVREFRKMESIIYSDRFATGDTQQTTPYKIINVDCEGNFSTFSPELLGIEGEPYGSFVIGNVHETSFREALNTPKFKRMYSHIMEGVHNCKRVCDYFSLCGGGTPSNKYNENGSFKSTETMHCRFRNQALVDVVLDKLEQKHNIGSC